MRRRTGSILLLSGFGLAVPLGLLGCSQIAAVAPVGGDHLAEVRYATIDVLLDQGVDVMVAPDCEQAADSTVTCTGETTDGERILSVSEAADPTRVTVTVGDDQVFDGVILDVLDDAARDAS
ncbi:hypothetical protein [Plantibacter flavus]|uniref:hypothetical protein n=1 Tax=Plantibacter flavus TaxID=150123 RepID=UPI003F5CCC57